MFGTKSAPAQDVFIDRYSIVEVEKPVTIIDPDAAASVRTLSGHPGFTYLLAKLKLQRSLLETKLKSSKHREMRDVEFLQSGIFWSKWLEDQINQEVYITPSAPQKPVGEDEAAIFERVRAAIETVGT